MLKHKVFEKKKLERRDTVELMYYIETVGKHINGLTGESSRENRTTDG